MVLEMTISPICKWLTRSQNNAKRARYTHDPNRERFIPPEDWKLLDYKPHPTYESISACDEGVVLRKGILPRYSLKKHNHGDYRYLGWLENGVQCYSPVSKLVYECMTSRLVLDGGLVDHRNGDTRDNRYSSNLRLASHVQNAQNRRKLDSNNPAQQFHAHYPTRLLHVQTPYT